MSRYVIILAVCLLFNVLAGPTIAAPTETTTKDPSSSESDSSASSTTGGSQKGTNATAPMLAAGNTHEALKGSTFTCLKRTVGYYADIERDCRVYHFCLLGEYNGEPVYQRVSYLCLNETVFDQQALDCVPKEKVSAPCEESKSYYAISNQILREAIVGNQMQQQNNGDQETSSTPSSDSASTSTTSTAAPSES